MTPGVCCTAGRCRQRIREFGDPLDGYYHDHRMHSADHIVVLDDQDDPVIWFADPPTAVAAELHTHQGQVMRFELFSADGTTGPPKNGRLVLLRDANGYSTTIAYKSWTQQELEESPSRRWQIDTITDAHGRIATFHYHSQQVGGRWVVSKIDLPEGESVEYGYGDAQLTSVDHPDGTQSTFSYNVVNERLTVTFFDAGAEGRQRSKRVRLSTGYSGGGEAGGH